MTTKDTLNNTMFFSYDSAGRLTGQQDALGQNSQFSYDSLGRLILETNAKNVSSPLISNSIIANRVSHFGDTLLNLTNHIGVDLDY